MATSVIQNLKLSSFNCKHFKDSGPKFDFMRNLMCQYDFLFVQEHCLYKSHLHKLKSILTAADVIGKSSMIESVALEGRPYGGCAIVYKTSIQASAEEIHCQHTRLCAALVCFNSYNKILLINTYMPCDSRMRDANYDVYVDVLSEIDRVIHATGASYAIIGGDLNTDLSRTTPQALCLREFLKSRDLISCINLNCANVPYTFIGANCTSIIDHFIIPSFIADSIQKYNIVDNHLISDHVPVCLELNQCVSHIDLQEIRHVCMTAWYEATDDQIGCN